MSDPYKVLGVSPEADEAEIKAAYRELARKYHPDNYEGNPLSDLALEKMQEVNDAYDRIVSDRRTSGGGNNYSGNYNSGNYNSGGASSQFSDIRRLINARRITEAEELLDGIPRSSRDAEWHFLKGSVQYTRGWLDEAYENFAVACKMEPSNTEYRNAYNQLQWQRNTGKPSGMGYRTGGAVNAGGCSMCDMCTALYCTDCCCECMGGDCIRCC